MKSLIITIGALSLLISVAANAQDSLRTEPQTIEPVMQPSIEIAPSEYAPELIPVLGERRYNRNRQEYFSVPNRPESFRAFEWRRYQRQQHRSKVGLGFGIAFLTIGTGMMITGAVLQATDQSNDEPCNPDGGDCDENMVVGGDVGIEIFTIPLIGFGGLFLIPGVVMTTVAAVRYKRAKKVLKLLDEERSAVSLNSIGAMPIPGGGAFGASFTF